MKKTRILLPAIMMAMLSVNTDLRAQISPTSAWTNTSPLSYTSGSVGIGSAPSITNTPTDAWLHIYGQYTPGGVPGTEPTCIGCGTISCMAPGYANPEVWIDRQYDNRFLPPCVATGPAANYFQISQSGYSLGMSGTVYTTTILDEFDQSGYLGITPKAGSLLSGRVHVFGFGTSSSAGVPEIKIDRTTHGLATNNYFEIWNALGTAASSIVDVFSSSGALGINTATPSTGMSLDVNGNALIQQNLTANLNGTIGQNLTVGQNGTFGNNVAVNGGQIDMTMPGDWAWRNINANTVSQGITISTGSAGGAYSQYSGGGYSDPGTMQFACNNQGSGITFWSYSGAGGGCCWNGIMRLNGQTNKVIIGNDLISTGNTPGDYLLYVETGILTDKLKVAMHTDGTNWSDFVFNKNYNLMPLSKVESYVKTNKHLPEIPSASDVAKDGLDVAAMDAKLLQKIEELTLYVIQQQKEIDELKQNQNK